MSPLALSAEDAAQRLRLRRGTASRADLLGPATWQVSVVPRVQLLGIGSWRNNSVAGQAALYHAVICRLDDGFVDGVLITGADVLVHGRYLVGVDDLEGVTIR